MPLVIMWVAHRNVKLALIASVGILMCRSNAKAPSMSIHEKIMATKDMRMHVGQVPTCRMSNILIIADGVIICGPLRLHHLRSH
jgi:hypothetical protein